MFDLHCKYVSDAASANPIVSFVIASEAKQSLS